MSTSQTSILVPIDSTDQTIHALQASYHLARLTNSKIVLFSIDEGDGVSTQKRIEALAKEASDKLGTQVEIIVAKGNIGTELKKVADVLHPAYIVLGLSPKVSKGNNIIGRNIYSALREIRNPVITITEQKFMDSVKTILLPLDLSKESREKVYQAIEMAKFYDAEIRIASILTSTDEEFENRMLSYSNQAWKLIKAEEVRCKLKTLRGKNAPKMVLDYAHEVGADLIMIMRQEELGFKDMFAGICDAERIMGDSDIPVLSYHPIQRRDTSVFIK